jgi:hypothetical protein
MSEALSMRKKKTQDVCKCSNAYAMKLRQNVTKLFS